MGNGKTAVHSDQAPAAIGPYSQAVRVGDFVYTSGQIALDPATGQITGTTAAEQTERVFENLKAVLAAAGTDLGRVFKTIVFLKNMSDFARNERSLRTLSGDRRRSAASPVYRRSGAPAKRCPGRD